MDEDWTSPWADQPSNSPLQFAQPALHPLPESPPTSPPTSLPNSLPKPPPNAQPPPKTLPFLDPLLHNNQQEPHPVAVSSNPSLNKPLPSPNTCRLSEIESNLTTSPSGISFEITVSDPIKMGDLVNSYISYKLTTSTNSSMMRNATVTVHRRYRDFLWLSNKLSNKYPGVIIPPVPEKHAIGRFQDEFIESRRIALERFIQKVALHPILQNDSDLGLFLESETFHDDMNLKKHNDSKGIIQTLGDAVKFGSNKSLDQQDSTSSLDSTPVIPISFNGTEHADFDESIFEGKKVFVDNLELQLKALYKALEALMKQRKDLSGLTGDFGESIKHLSGIQVSTTLSAKLTCLSEIQEELKDVYGKQSKTDFFQLAACVEDWIRIVVSIRNALSIRNKSYQHHLASEANLSKKREALEKLRSAKLTRSDKISVLNTEIDQCEKVVLVAKKDYQDLSRLVLQELDRCDQERIVDFCKALGRFLKNYISSQKEIIEILHKYK